MSILLNVDALRALIRSPVVFSCHNLEVKIRPFKHYQLPVMIIVMTNLKKLLARKTILVLLLCYNN
jgi:hypothetical protein